MALLEEIQAKCAPELIASRDHQAIADAVNIGRVRRNDREIGNGSILEAIGLTAGNALLDVINSTQDFRHVKPLVEQGRLQIGSPLVQATVQSMVGTVLTQPQADALMSLGFEPDPATAQQISDAMGSI